MKKVTDRADDLTYTGAMDFKDGADKAVEYAYDANGNMTSDLNRGIVSITYNQLNLPQSVLFKDGHESRYTYAADGRKLRAEYRLNNFQVIDKSDASGIDWAEQSTIGDGMVVKPGITDSVKADNPYYTTLTVRDYCGSYIYKNGKLERVLTDNGYWQDGELYFYIKDYQGNVRVVLDQRNQPVELNAYYPYGMLMAATPSDSKQPHKYGAKELDRENGLDLYDSQARWYAPQIGRTSTLDPMAEKYPHLSPYLWCAANPITLTDPTGKELKPKGEEELQVIKNTIPAEARRFVVINDEGFIDKNKLEEYSGDSYNFQILKYIVNSPITMFVELNDNYNYIDENGELKNSTMTYYDFNPLYDNEDDKDKTGSTISGLSTGETGKMGITLFPDRAGFSGSTNNTIHVIINKNLSEKGAAETYSHEANGHGALYILNGYNHRGASHHFRGTKDTNIKLIDMIIKSKTETVKNMK